MIPEFEKQLSLSLVPTIRNKMGDNCHVGSASDVGWWSSLDLLDVKLPILTLLKETCLIARTRLNLLAQHFELRCRNNAFNDACFHFFLGLNLVCYVMIQLASNRHSSASLADCAFDFTGGETVFFGFEKTSGLAQCKSLVIARTRPRTIMQNIAPGSHPKTNAPNIWQCAKRIYLWYSERVLR